MGTIKGYGSAKMHVIDATGDTRTTWDPASAEEVAAVRAKFDELLAQGHTAFKVGTDGNDVGERIEEFDPLAETIIVVPQLAGG